LPKVNPDDDAPSMNIDYPVLVKRSDEGYAVGCVALQERLVRILRHNPVNVFTSGGAELA
jgi:hypothetical protein